VDSKGSVQCAVPIELIARLRLSKHFPRSDIFAYSERFIVKASETRGLSGVCLCKDVPPSNTYNVNLVKTIKCALVIAAIDPHD